MIGSRVGNKSRQQAIASDSRSARLFGLTSLTATAIPKFSKEQMVCFIGGVGTVKNYRPDSGAWTYTIEMEPAPDANTGRVGCETAILLPEAEIQAEIQSAID